LRCSKCCGDKRCRTIGAKLDKQKLSLNRHHVAHCSRKRQRMTLKESARQSLPCRTIPGQWITFAVIYF